ncbi:MAG: DUF1565 domain-containing protein, partial [Muribaculaceae bacterium]|nr:DUF1565 domain-containing protein [Muribaculaceae bacterium]
MNIRVIQSILTIIVAISANAAHYYVSSDVINGVVYNHNDDSFIGGSTAFKSISEALTHVANDDVISIQSGVYSENITITTPGITLLGHNAYGETRSQTRSAPETSITGTITVNADRVTVNGFRFTESGCIVASEQTPINDFTFAFNTVEAVTNEHPIVKINNAIGLTISNNVFNGTSCPQSELIKVNASSGQTDITGNTFSECSHCINITESHDAINICHNIFRTVNVCAISLQCMGVRDKVQISICDNMFDGCRTSDKTFPVMLEQSNDGTHMTAATQSALMFNRNVIKNFSPKPDADFYYFLWAEASDCSPIAVDTRFNRCDNSSVAFGTTPPKWETQSQRYFAGSTGLFDFEQASADYYRNPAGTQQHQYALKTNAAAQSFDIDTETGDIYYIQT